MDDVFWSLIVRILFGGLELTVQDATVVFGHTGCVGAVSKFAQQREKASEYLERVLEIDERV